MVDIDHFKDINDTYGHVMGDNALVEVAISLRAACSEDAIISRIGGDEFVIIITDLNASSFEEIIKRLEAMQVEIPFDEEQENLIISLSIGFSICNIHTSLDDMFSKADKNMYIAKALHDKGVVITKENE